MSHIEELEVRLSRLESRYRRVQLLCAASCTLLVGACLTAALAPVSDELHARRFVLEDDQGKECGVLDTNEGASTLKLTGSGATLLLGAGEVQYNDKVIKGFRVSRLGGEFEELSETKVTKGPWAGVIAWTGSEEKADSIATLSAADARTGLGASYDDKSADLYFAYDYVMLKLQRQNSSTASLIVGDDDGAALSLEGKDGANDAMIIAGEEVAVGGGCGEDRRFALTATKEEVRCGLTTRPLVDSGEEALPEDIELTAKDGGGAVRVRSGDDVIFHTP